MLHGLRTTLSLVSDAFRRALMPPEVRALTGGSGETVQEFDPERALSTLATYPWARVGVLSVAADLSGLQLTATVDGTRVDVHPFLSLMKRPDVGWSGVRWRRQIVSDLKGTGNAYARLYRDNGRLYRMRRIHPRRMAAIVEDGEIVAWRIDGQQIVSVAEIMHVADVSWREDESTATLGESPARALHMSTQAAVDARRQAGRAAKRGRLEMMLSAKSPLGSRGVDDIVNQYVESTQKGNGVFVTSANLAAQPLSLSPRDTEWNELDLRTRDETLAVHGVPPVRAQLPSANYGAAKQEMRQYWESSCMRLADLIDAELSYVADPTGRTEIRHSFEAIEALQTSYTERLSRVKMWVDLGASPYDAARHEGFAVPPLDVDTEPRASGAPASPPSASVVDAPAARSTSTLRELAEVIDAALTGGAGLAEVQALSLAIGCRIGLGEHHARELAEVACEHYQLTGRAESASLLAFDPDGVPCD